MTHAAHGKAVCPAPPSRLCPLCCPSVSPPCSPANSNAHWPGSSHCLRCVAGVPRCVAGWDPVAGATCSDSGTASAGELVGCSTELRTPSGGACRRVAGTFCRAWRAHSCSGAGPIFFAGVGEQSPSNGRLPVFPPDVLPPCRQSRCDHQRRHQHGPAEDLQQPAGEHFLAQGV